MECEAGCGVVPAHLVDCAVCGRFAGYPNVRSAETDDERSALQERVRISRLAATVRGVQKELQNFSCAVSRSVVVMNRHLQPLHTWVNGDNPHFNTFYNQVDFGREPENNPWDRQRGAVESAIHPHYFENITPAALSIDNYGMPYYGAYCLVFSENKVGHRASVFEENPFEFAKRHTVIVGREPPKGYRAVWANRNLLAEAKLAGKIVPNMQHKDFVKILIEPNRNDSNCDFVEVHIYGPIHKACIARVAGPEPKSKADKVLWRQIKRKFEATNVEIEVVEWTF